MYTCSAPPRELTPPARSQSFVIGQSPATDGAELSYTAVGSAEIAPEFLYSAVCEFGEFVLQGRYCTLASSTLASTLASSALVSSTLASSTMHFVFDLFFGLCFGLPCFICFCFVLL